MGEVGGFGEGSGGNKRKRSKRKLSPKKAKALEGLISGKSMRQASKDAGFSQSMADNAGIKVFTPDVMLALNEELEKAGITNQLLAQRIKEGIDAEIVKVATFEGRISDERAYPDMEQRGRYVDRVLELTGRIKRGGANVEVNVPVMWVSSVPRPNYGAPQPSGSDAQTQKQE